VPEWTGLIERSVAVLSAAGVPVEVEKGASEISSGNSSAKSKDGRKRMSAKTKIDMTSSDREIVVTRVFDAPRRLVFGAWTDPEQLKHWWGPQGFTLTTLHMEVKPGGVWKFVMHGPDGVDYPNQIVYTEIVEPELLAYKHRGDAEAEPVHFQVAVTFEAQGDRTKVTSRMVFPSAAAREHVVKTYHADEGAEQTFERLGRLLEKPLAEVRDPA
jgi:uncharacterized protein YndB with AHSA1/START domain